MARKHPDTHLPLSPYRVLDLTEGGCNLAGKILGDLGADVIRIEPPFGSKSRCTGPFFHGQVHPEKSLFWFAFNLNKRGITLNLETADGQSLFRQLAGTSDIVIESYGDRKLLLMRLSYEDLSRDNPALVWATLTGFGQDGPYAGFEHTDMILWAMSGLQYATGDPDRPPVRISVPMAEAVTGAHAASGIMHALWYRIRTGEGQRVDVTGQIATLTANMAVSAYATSETPIKREGEFRDVGYTRMRQLYRCKDGYVAGFLMQGKWGAEFNGRLAAWMLEDGPAPDYFDGFDWTGWTPGVKMMKGLADEANEEVRMVEEPVQRFFETKTKLQIFERALEYQLLLAPVLTSRDLYEWQHLKERGFWQPVEHPELGVSLDYPGAFINMSETPIQFRRRAPLIGEHNREIYVDELGLSDDDLRMLCASGAV
jgi:crotonobetainyl-CoA:carnitine CoA-transferase CaiB-like acyl-CoA transferase